MSGTEPRTDVYSPVLGTVLELTVSPGRLADPLAEVVLAEIARLSQILSGWDDDSSLSRWQRGEISHEPLELSAVLRCAQSLFDTTDGAFHPALRPLLDLWRQAGTEQRPPNPSSLSEAADRLRELPFRDGHRRPGADLSTIDLDGIAKGYIVDAVHAEAMTVARAAAAEADLTLNIGGDLRHAGPIGRVVRIENPLSPFDNAPPLTEITVRNAALATSGTTRRGVRIGERWFTHVIDPRTGQPVGHTASASVLAHDTMTADALATAALVLPVEQATALLEQHAIGGLLVSAQGSVTPCGAWPDPPSTSEAQHPSE